MVIDLIAGHLPTLTARQLDVVPVSVALDGAASEKAVVADLLLVLRIPKEVVAVAFEKLPSEGHRLLAKGDQLDAVVRAEDFIENHSDAIHVLRADLKEQRTRLGEQLA